ncbi:hypothetical protein WR25_09213 [Diploscapter pachys]|uniref:RUN and TBC1 domain-containing protein 3 n=1 Tax=Diploscapter pachys TaxID=2018661 RepID=A0A2A2KU35_9BILA|nr:hypothetical protein WR25_09213 [Diploscapter pachys]
MAKYKKGKDAKFADVVVSDDEDFYPISARKLADTTKEIDRPIHESLFALDGSPMSAINRELIPVYIEDPKEWHEIWLKFISMLEQAHAHIKDELHWSHIDASLLKNEKFEQLLKEGGIPHSMRPYLWARLSGATKKQKEAVYSYEDVLRQSAQDKPSIGVQIERDLLRTQPNNICFWKKNGPGIDALRRILKSVAFIYPDLGYCQGMGVVVAILLLFCSEETTFWIMSALVEDILPPNYYSQTLLGLQADERVSRHLMKSHVPDLNRSIDELDVEISLLTANWLLTLFGSVLPTKTLLRIWDFIFYSGTVNIFRVIVSLLKMREDEIVEVGNRTKSAADVFNAISQLPGKTYDYEKLIEYMSSFEFTITDHLIKELRKKHQAILMADQGMIVNTAVETNLPKQRTQRRKLTRSKSIIQQILAPKEQVLNQSNPSYSQAENDPKLKNVRQTEILVDLKESVLQLCRYFASCDEKMELSISMQADYSPESHQKDLDNYLNGRRKGHKRARALLDFARQDEDELGFRKNDIITIISEKDEHCWVVDERGKDYSIYGDEAVSPEITEYIRGRLANSFRQIMDHGIRESILYANTAYHPWAFIEDISTYAVEKHFNSVYSRLTLCNTFKLDQECKILTPQELLFRYVQAINDSHNGVSAHPDVKLRSLLAMGVNEQCLHLWFELLCAPTDQEHIRNKYYHSWAFIRSPAWKQIKCDLRLLCQFSFNLNMDFEIEDKEKKPKKKSNGIMISGKKTILSTVATANEYKAGEEPLKQGVTEMLIKHHLFSWDL